MHTYQFKCTLLSDVIISQQTSTEAVSKTLDFIPGNNFLGIAARDLYYTQDNDPNRLSLTDSSLAFHSGHIRFGDAHPAYQNIRTLRIPASIYTPKSPSETQRHYIYHYYERIQDTNWQGMPQQLKQCRNGFYAFKDNIGIKIKHETSFSVKSAYDRILRKAKDQQMYGYQAIDKGSTFFFEIECDKNVPHQIQERIIHVLTNSPKHIGRSKTAQYGLISIECLNNSNCSFSQPESKALSQKFATVYADARLIFIDPQTLSPSFLPTASQLGFDQNAKIMWEKSQIRTFQYAPWNAKRQCRDTDRCGIEKGSVFVIDCQTSPQKTTYIGSYQNEGFGKVIYNPAFLDPCPNTNGETLYTIRNEFPNNSFQANSKLEKNSEKNKLLLYLQQRKDTDESTIAIYDIVNKFIERESNIFRSSNESFSSQWGTIRTIASQCRNKKDIESKLFNEQVGYLSHGIAKDKWMKFERIKVLQSFCEQAFNKFNDNEELACKAILNLASEMSKLK